MGAIAAEKNLVMQVRYEPEDIAVKMFGEPKSVFRYTFFLDEKLENAFPEGADMIRAGKKSVPTQLAAVIAGRIREGAPALLGAVGAEPINIAFKALHIAQEC